eukprot:gene11776-15709_t
MRRCLRVCRFCQIVFPSRSVGTHEIGWKMSPHHEQSRTSSLLIVDDDAAQCSVIGRIAQKLGYTTTSVSSFDQAAALLSNSSFDCITVDLSLGERDGIEFLRLIGELRPIPHVVVISGCEARLVNAAVRMAYAAGIMNVRSVSKPLDFGLLRTTLAFIRSRRPSELPDHGPVIAIDERHIAKAL